MLLRYPDDAMLACLDDVAAALPAVGDAGDRARLAAVCDALRQLPPTAAAQGYVAVFDHTRRRCLHLTYYRHGDTRGRGMALLALKHAYRRAGWPPPESDLPDFLPLVLEFAALEPEPGRRILMQCRAGLELLREGLHAYRAEDDGGTGGGGGGRSAGAGTDAGAGPVPYAGVLDTLCGRLPEPRRGERETWRRLAAEGPPEEAVGLEPFGPPEQTGYPAPAPSPAGAFPAGSFPRTKEGR